MGEVLLRDALRNDNDTFYGKRPLREGRSFLCSPDMGIT